MEEALDRPNYIKHSWRNKHIEEDAHAVKPSKYLVIGAYYFNNSIEITNEEQANLLCYLIPSACPFARTINLGTFKLVIPPLCKINPLYEQLMELRFKAQCYLAEVETL